MRSRILIAVIGICFTCACQTGGAATPLPSSSVVSSPVPSSGWLTPSFLHAWPHAAGWFVPIQQTDGRQFFLNSVTSTPDWVVGYLGTPPADPQNQGLQNPVAALLNVHDGSTVAIVKLDPKQAQGSFDADSGYVVWVEAADPTGTAWRVLAKPFGANSTPVIVAKSQATGASQGGSFVFPHIDHSTIVWSQMAGQLSEVYIAGPSGTTPEKIASDASGPLIGWPLVAYDLHASPSAPINQFVIGLYNLQNQRQTVLDDINSPSSWAVSSYGLAWVDSSRKKLFVRDLRTGTSKQIADVSASRTNYLQFPAMNDRFVAWSQEGGEWIYDLKSGRAVQLSEHRLFNSVWLHGDTLAWPVPLPQSDPAWKPWNGLRGYYVVDTRSLS